MKIGDEVYVHGYIDEIRQDTVIIRNDGGYFGTAPSETLEQDPSEDCINRYSALAELDPLSYEYKVIKELPNVVPSKAESNADLISRQDALDAIAKFVPYVIDDISTESYTNGLKDAYNLIYQLPIRESDEE